MSIPPQVPPVPANNQPEENILPPVGGVAGPAGPYVFPDHPDVELAQGIMAQAQLNAPVSIIIIHGS